MNYERLIPSKYMRELFQSENFELDEEKQATIIVNSDVLTWDEKLEGLKELMAQTKNEDLKKQLKERIDFESGSLEMLSVNTNRYHIYSVLDEDSVTWAHFTTYELAELYARHLAEGDLMKTSVEKNYVIRDEDTLYNKSNLWTPLDDPEHPQSNEEYEGGRTWFNRRGERMGVYSLKTAPGACWHINTRFYPRFEHRFFAIPFDIKTGTIVRDVRTDKHYVLETGAETWPDYIESVKTMNYVDFSDIQVVALELQDGRWSHSHINPIYLDTDLLLKEGDERERAYAKVYRAMSSYIRKRWEKEPVEEEAGEVLAAMWDYAKVSKYYPSRVDENLGPNRTELEKLMF